MTDHELLQRAAAARGAAYAPYSGFAVGAALLCTDGTVYTGCNIENASYTPTVCAERTAVFKAVSEGNRDFSAIAIVGGTAPCSPCGVCRQVLSEFCGADFAVVLQGENGDPIRHTLGELLPLQFHL